MSENIRCEGMERIRGRKECKGKYRWLQRKEEWVLKREGERREVMGTREGKGSVNEHG